MPKSAHSPRFCIGFAGWNIPRSSAGNFPSEGSHLERYARKLTAVEINTSFYRPHRPSTYARWAASVFGDFSFSVKMPKQITHKLRLSNALDPTKQFLLEASALGNRLGCILVQLPPSLEFVPSVADTFFTQLRELHDGHVACEPRHATWFSPSANDMLQRHRVARVAADPAPHPGAEKPAGNCAMNYFRLHGSPKIYYSRYSDEYLIALAGKLTELSNEAEEVWCVFDNTAEGYAADNALQLLALINET